jgi:hypothetical protein
MASYFAMTRLAEMAGCRWYMPGKLGEIIPRQDRLTFLEGTHREVPAVWSRFLWLNGGDADTPGFHRWMLHNRQYGVPVPSGHICSFCSNADVVLSGDARRVRLAVGGAENPAKSA